MNESEKEIRYESIAYHNWVGSLNKNGFPKNANGSSMNSWELYTYYIKESGKREIYVNHAKDNDTEN